MMLKFILFSPTWREVGEQFKTLNRYPHSSENMTLILPTINPSLLIPKRVGLNMKS